jgi:hypothetical protein
MQPKNGVDWAEQQMFFDQKRAGRRSNHHLLSVRIRVNTAHQECILELLVAYFRGRIWNGNVYWLLL